MRYYVLVDNSCGNVEGKFNWGDDRDLPVDYPLAANHQIITLFDADGENLDSSNSCYNPNTETFGPKLTITSEVTQFDHSNSATVTITYPVDTINEACNLSIDGQTVTVNIVNGVGSFNFTSQITEWHTLTASSSSFYGKNNVIVEVM